jgi:luciferase family oxidoreductase group 1
VVPGQGIRAVPGAGVEVPIWLLGSSLFSAQVAALLGLPFAFASHFAPDELFRALDVYRTRFTPSKQLEKPYAIAAANVVAADTDAEARRQFTSQQQSFVNLRRGTPGQVPPPIDDIDAFWSALERDGVERALTHSFVGSPETVERGLRRFRETTRADEIMVTAHLAEQRARVRSLELVADIARRLE